MSESSSEPTSSQLDDIELAQSRNKTYEHDTDVGFLFGKEKQQWGLPVMPGRDSPQAISSSMKDEADYHLSSAPAVESAPRGPDARDALARLTHDSGAVPGVPTPAAPPFASRHSELRDAHFARAPDGIQGQSVTIDVLSAAFTLNEHAWQQGRSMGKSPSDVICQRTCTGLGVDNGSLRYYELREVPASQLQPSGHYAVAVDRSGVPSSSRARPCFEKVW